jgi:hypothetical protein
MSRRLKAKTAEEPTPIGETVQEVVQAVTPAEPSIAANTSESAETENGQKQWTDQGPRGRHLIHLGDGRRIRFIRNNAMQQVGITFEADEGIDPRPSKEDTEFLKEHGFRWRGPEKLWTLQLISPNDKEEIETIAADQGEQQARLERGKRRSAADRAAEEVFVTLANTIRVRNHQEPIAYNFGQERTPF